MSVRQAIHGGIAALVGALLIAAPASAAGEKGARVGTLECTTVEGTRTNLIITSTADIKCIFKSVDGKAVELYRGETGIGLGVDLKIEKQEKIIFAVFSANFKPGTHQLSGKYGGAKATVSAGVGGGAQLLVGGSNDSVSLQPAVVGNEAVGVAAGLSYMSLQPDT